MCAGSQSKARALLAGRKVMEREEDGKEEFPWEELLFLVVCLTCQVTQKENK